MLNNKQALELLLKAFAQFNDQSLTCIIGCDHSILDITTAGAALYNSDRNSIIGSDAISTFRTNKTIIDSIKNIIDEVIRDKKPIRALSINFLRPLKYQLLVSEYKPIINNDTGDVIAVKLDGHKLSYPIAWYKLPRMNIINPSADTGDSLHKQDDGTLTEIEREIIFLYLACNNYVDTADILNMKYEKKYTGDSIRMTIYRRIFTKLNVQNMPALKAKVLKLGYHKNIPQSLFGDTIIRLQDL